MGSKKTFATALVVVLAMFVAACGDDNSSSGSGGGSTKKATTTADTGGGAKAPTLAASEGATGNVTYCLGKDTAGNNKAAVKDFNAANAASGLKAKLLEFPESADEQRNQFVQRQEAKSPECDVFLADVIWTAEFAQQKWLLDMSDYVNSRKDEFIPSTLETIHYNGAYYGVPQATDSAFMYYRTDKVSSVPQTWQELYSVAKDNGGIVYQGASYEGLTCDYLELAFAAGGQVLSADGKKSLIDSPENLKALQFMVDGVKSGVAPKAVTTYMEEQSRRSFESGKPAFMRNWPYAYALGNQKGSKTKGKFKVAPFPTFAAVEKMYAAKYSIAPVLNATYDDPDVQKALPFAAELKQAVTQAKSRPVSPVYPQISQAIYKNVNKALAGQMTPQDALKAADGQINQALATF
jgi:multiple sugar transport system substrate-binding protein